MPKEKFNVHQAVTDRILDALKEGVVPWQRPWRVEGGTHCNLNSKKPYRGVNQFLLDLTSMAQGYSSPYWMTYKGAEKLDGQVRKGEKSTMVIFWKRIIVDDRQNPGDTKAIGFYKYYNVFNAAQVDGIEDRLPKPAEKMEFNPIEAAESIWKEYPNAPELIHNGDRATYSPQLDKIMMPKHEQFNKPESYYATLFHEAAHSTGHATRLNRDGITKTANFGSDPYAKEELIAEITAAFLNSMCGIIDDTIDNTAAYLNNWMSKLRSDEKLIVRAAAEAQKASDHILGVKWENDNKED